MAWNMDVANFQTVRRRFAWTALQYGRIEAERLIDDVVDVC